MQIINDLDTSVVLVASQKDIPVGIDQLIVLHQGRLKEIYQRPFPPIEINSKHIDLNQNVLNALFPKIEDGFETHLSTNKRFCDLWPKKRH